MWKQESVQSCLPEWYTLNNKNSGGCKAAFEKAKKACDFPTMECIEMLFSMKPKESFFIQTCKADPTCLKQEKMAWDGPAWLECFPIDSDEFWSNDPCIEPWEEVETPC